MPHSLHRFRLSCWPGVLVSLALSMSVVVSPAAAASLSEDLAGQWDVTLPGTARFCRITLNAQQSDRGDFFVGVPLRCRQVLPILARLGRWAVLDKTHLVLSEPGGRPILALAADGEAFSAQGGDGQTYRLVSASGRSVVVSPAVVAPAAGPPQEPTEVQPVAMKPSRAAEERPSDLAGRYAILRDGTHDTGCMLTLDDKTRVKGGARAALAPACRDQGIVVFDPSAWQIVNGRLVLTAKAGHVTHLDKQGDGSWMKDPKEGKSLSLKKL